MATHETPKAQTQTRTRLGRFMRDRSGATAVEFAMVVGPLLFMLFSIIELALVFLTTATLENATTEVARTVRTGIQQKKTGAATPTAATFRADICKELGWMQSQCNTNLQVDVRTFTEFSNPPISDLNSATGVYDPNKLKFELGSQGDIVLVRSFYTWTQITPFLPMGGLQEFTDSAGKKTKQIIAAATFRNEPY